MILRFNALVKIFCSACGITSSCVSSHVVRKPPPARQAAKFAQEKPPIPCPPVQCPPFGDYCIKNCLRAFEKWQHTVVRLRQLLISLLVYFRNFLFVFIIPRKIFLMHRSRRTNRRPRTSHTSFIKAVLDFFSISASLHS